MATNAAYDPKPTVIWEMTRACDLGCRHCPNDDHDTPSPLELQTYEAYKTIDEIAAVHPSRFVISGGDPLLRQDLDQIIDYARRRGLDPALTLCPTAAADGVAVRRLRRKGLKRVIVSVDDAEPEAHDALRSVDGAFHSTLRLISTALAAGLQVEVNTLVTRRTAGRLSVLHERLAELPLAAWNLYLLVPLPGWAQAEMMTPADVDLLFQTVGELRSSFDLPIRLFEAPEERRYQLEAAPARIDPKNDPLDRAQWADFSGYVAIDSETPEEILFIAHSGEVWPSEFLPIAGGNIRYCTLSSIHRNGEIFRALRDRANLKGTCGRCEYRAVCGGSRARAYAMTGDPFEADPLCTYRPGTLAMKRAGT
jgi:radical SAM protein with 4Fe4S-binding SPASM domain